MMSTSLLNNVQMNRKGINAMVINRFSQLVRLAALSALVLPMAACGGGNPSGVYVAKGQALFDKLDFQSGNKVAVTAFGQVLPGEFIIMDDGRIKVMASNGGVATLKKASDGCLEFTGASDEEAQAAQREGMNPADFGRFCRE
jgi:hypothetical protein